MSDPKDLYLDLLKKTLTFYLWEDRAVSPMVQIPKKWHKRLVFELINRFLYKRNLQIAHKVSFDPLAREAGVDWPQVGETMIGLKRLNNLQECIESVVVNKIPGDLIETGVWRGGAVIFMRAVLKAYGEHERNVWVADSFEGLPNPSPDEYPADEGSPFHQFSALRVSMEEVKNNFARYGLLDDKVKFLKGWFKDTLPSAPIKEISILRLDGDMYESTTDALTYLYPKLVKEGYIIIDDYHIKACRNAVEDYRKTHNILEPITWVDQSGVFWQKNS